MRPGDRDGPRPAGTVRREAVRFRASGAAWRWRLDAWLDVTDAIASGGRRHDSRTLTWILALAISGEVLQWQVGTGEACNLHVSQLRIPRNGCSA